MQRFPPTRLSLWILILALAGPVVYPGLRAQTPAAFPAPPPAAAAPAPPAPPKPDPAALERRALAEKFNALPDPEFSACVKTHPEVRTPEMVQTLLRYGRELSMHGDNAAHARLVARAGEIADAMGDRLSQARVQWNAAGMEGELHHVDKGLAMIDRAIAIATEEKAPPRDLAGMLGCRVVLFGYKGEYARAMADCGRALELATEANYPDGAMAALTTIINIYQRQGQPERSVPYLEQARKWAAGNDHMLMYVEGNAATTFHQMGDAAKARESLGRALEIARRLGDENMVADFLGAAAQYAGETGDFAAAHGHLDEAMTLARKLGNDRVVVDTQLQQAELEEKQGNHAAAITAARAALAGAEGTGERESISQAQTLLGRALAASGQTAEAEGAFTAAVGIIEQMRTGAAGDEEATQAMLQRHIDPYQRLTALLAASGRAPAAFATAESAKARVLRDILQHGRLDLASALTDAERQRQTDARDRVATLGRDVQKARSGGVDAKTVKKAQAALDAARLEARNLDDVLLSTHPEARRPEIAARASVPAVAAATGDDATLLLEFSVSPDSTTLFVAGPGKGGLAARVLSVGEDALRGRVEAFRRALADRSLRWKEGADALGQLLLDPVGGRLAKARRVVIVPDGPLWDLPFQALVRPDGGDCLIDRLAVSYAPSAAFLEQVRRANASPRKPNGGGRLLAMGNPSLGDAAQHKAAATLMGDDLAPLPAAEDEVRALGKMYGEDQRDIFLGAEAREDVFKREAPRCDILHLATHGLLNDANPMYSCLLMAQTGLAPGEDGLLEAREIMGLRLHARLAVLAACETARGKAGAGEGQLGLSWALLVAGCPASVVSQWKVDSRSNVDLMLDLHRQLRAGKPPDEAMRQAALALRKTPGYENPFYWAPFVVVGDGR